MNQIFVHFKVFSIE